MKNSRKATIRVGCGLLALLLILVSLAGCAIGQPLDFPGTGDTTATDPGSETAPVSDPSTDPQTGDREPDPYDSIVGYLEAQEDFPAYDQGTLIYLEYYYSLYYIGKNTVGTPSEVGEVLLSYFDEYKASIDLSSEDEVTDLLCECYLAAVGDKYAYYMNPEAFADYNSDIEGNYVGIGVQVVYDSTAREITVTAVFPDTPAYEAGVLPGDLLYSVEGVLTSELSFYEAIDRVKGEEGTDVTVGFMRNGELLSKTMTRRSVVQVTVSGDTIGEGGKIGFIRITEFDDTTTVQFKDTLDSLLDGGAEALIFDLRNNPGGTLNSILAILDYLVPNGTPLASYYYYNGRVEGDYATDGHEIPSDLPIAVLCNETTASAGELFTCALQDYGKAGLLNVSVVGTVTFGKGTMQTLLSLPGGRATTISIAYYNPPYSGNYEGKGVTPDLISELTGAAAEKSIYALTEEEDTQLQDAKAEVARLAEEYEHERKQPEYDPRKA